MEIKKNINEIDCWTYGDHFYFEENDIKVSVFHSSVNVTFLDNAMKRGKHVPKVSYSVYHDEVIDSLRENNVNVSDFIKGILAEKDYYHTVAEELSDYKTKFHEVLGVDVSVSSSKGVRIFSPFAKFKPFKKEPKDWNISNVIKGLMTGQIHDVTIKGKYSDDYAYDSATNYSEGVCVDSMDMAQKLVESRSGWRTRKEGNNKISICCHTFDIREAILDSFDVAAVLKRGLSDA